MKARHIKKLRERIKTFNTYEVRGCMSLPHGFFADITLKVRADSHDLALKRFFRYNERMMKCKHDDYMPYPSETTEERGKIRVKSLKSGIIVYYK